MTATKGIAKTVVSVTPVAIERDSRTLKQAASLVRAGYRSIVVEGERSRLDPGELPFELVTPAGVPEAWGSDHEQAGGPHGRPIDEQAPPAGNAAGRRGLVRRGLWFVYTRWFALLERLMPGFNPRWWEFKSRLRWTLNGLRSLPRADLYIVHSPRPYPAVALRRLLAPGARHAYDAHDAYFEIVGGGEGVPPRPGQPTWERLERRCVSGASYFATVSDGLADLLEERFGRRPAVIRNCQDPRLNRPAPVGLRERLGLSGSDYLLVSIGNHKAGLGVAALEAIRRLPADVHLALVGRGYDELWDAIEERDLEGRVHLIGPVPPTEVASFIGSADAAVTLYEPLDRNYERMLPNGFFHGLAAGLPMLYPQTSPEVAALGERYGLGLSVDPLDPDSIAAAVARLSGDPALARQLRAGAERAGEEESWEHEERRFLLLVEGAVGSGMAATQPPTAASAGATCGAGARRHAG
ncbi:MAG TPA: glycosyltransferase [Solirubrobacterales bacterium]